MPFHIAVHIVMKAYLSMAKRPRDPRTTYRSTYLSWMSPHIYVTTYLSWMSNANLRPATEASICAIQEQAVTTRYIEKHIHKTSSNDRCRLCNKFPETIHHIIAGCPSLSQTLYTDRHNKVLESKLCFDYPRYNWLYWNYPPRIVD